MNFAHSCQTIEQIIWSDPGHRGVRYLALPGELARAAASLVDAKNVAIVTGFFLVDQQTYETDGPPGALAIGRACDSLQIPVEYHSDSFGRSILQDAGLEPIQGSPLTGSFEHLPTHLVSVERLGRASDGHYYSMRGRDLSAVTEPIDQMFRDASSLGIVTVGIGDGGNEIGMGRVFDQVVSHIPNGATIASTVATDFLITAGTSNWGAWGVVAAMSLLNRRNLLPTLEEAHVDLQRLIDASCCDGVTGCREMTVDGLSTDNYLAPLRKLREIVDHYSR